MMLKMRENFYELYNDFIKRAMAKNRKYRQMLVNSALPLDSKEMLSFIVSECLMEDIETIDKLESNGFSRRYIDFVIRNMTEQVIEYLYIMKHPQMIGEYFGNNLPDDWKGTNLFNGMKRTGKKRFKNRPQVSTMAHNIGEKTSSDGNTSLYEIYSLKSEMEHHSYFNHSLDVMTVHCSGENSESKEELDYVYLLNILTKFIKVYDIFL